jgi:hypothetical protein
LHVSSPLVVGKAAAADHCAKPNPTGRNSRRRIVFEKTLGVSNVDDERRYHTCESFEKKFALVILLYCRVFSHTHSEAGTGSG